MSYNPREVLISDADKADELADEENEIADEEKEIEDKEKEIDHIEKEIEDEEKEIEDEENETVDGAVRAKVELIGKHSNRKGIIFDLIFYALLIFVCIYIIPNYVIQRTVVDGTSMENTLSNGDQLYVEKLSYHFDALKRFDIIVFYPYGRENNDYYVKRIIGLPSETVQIIGSNIYINGESLEEHYGKDPITDPGRAEEPIKLADDEYFVMGDNRSVSKDSRSEDVGNIKLKNIGGKVILRIKPLNKFGTVK